MKKTLSLILSIILLVLLFNFNVSAANYNALPKNETIINETIEYFPDGSTITTITQQINNIETFATTKTVSGTKTKTVKNSDGEILYKFKINGTFSVNVGASAVCTAVSCSASELASGWSLDSSTTSKSGNTAKATGVFKHKVLFVTNVTQEVSNTLSCDKDGVLS